MITTPLRERMQAVADFRTMTRQLRNSARWTLFWGGLALALSFVPPGDLVLTVLGVALLSVGLWNIMRPHATGLIVDGVTVMLVGIYNIASTVLAASAHSGTSSAWARIGVFQIIAGIVALRRYPRYARSARTVPGDSELSVMDQRLDRIAKAKVKETSDVIEVITAKPLSAKAWKIELGSEGALAVTRGSDDVRVLDRSQLEITSTGKGFMTRRLKAKVRFGDEVLQGSIFPDMLERYQAWKAGTPVVRAIAA